MRPSWIFLSATVVCAVLAALVFSLGLPGTFIFDDGPNIVHNQAIHISELRSPALQQAAFAFQPGGGSRPLAMLSFALDHWRAGLDPTAFKTTNLAIHALTNAALAYLLRAILLLASWPPRRAAVAALLMATAWAVHPLQVSSVLYVVQRMQTLATLFLVLAMLAYTAARQAQIAGQPSRRHWILVVLCGVLAFASKEDAIAVPGYLLALELTVLRFRAVQPHTERVLRWGWAGVAGTGFALYLLVALPHFWEAQTYPGRDYGSLERLLTQARVLVMYLWQILLPLPSHMPFYYDWLAPSRGLWHPWTTLTSIAVLLVLVGLAWRMRLRRPLLSLGLTLFFAGHFISSNVLGLELAFEHRNHFALIGIVLAIGDLLDLGLRRLRIRPAVEAALCLLPLLLLAGAAAARAHLWSDPVTLAQRHTDFAPESARAWNSLCLLNYELSGHQPGPYLDRAIAACEAGADRDHAVTALTNLVLFKTIRGDVGASDWSRFHARLRTVTMSPENTRALWVVMNPAREDAPLDEAGVLGVIDIVTGRTQLRPVEYAAIGYYILDRTRKPELSYRYFALAVEHSPPGSVFATELAEDLHQQGRDDWSKRLRAMMLAKEESGARH